jgi:hypothetical protein
MPKLVVLAACERVLIDRTAALPSLINIFQRMNIKLQDAPLPENAVSPARWAVFTLWQHTPEELGMEFTQQLEIINPAGAKFIGATSKFIITEEFDLQSKVPIEILGLPINHEGFIKVRVWLEGYPDATGEYQFMVKHLPKEKHDEQSPIIAATT